jgi:hypothetical protein
LRLQALGLQGLQQRRVGMRLQHGPDLGHLLAGPLLIAVAGKGQRMVGAADGQHAPDGGLVRHLQQFGHGLAQRLHGLRVTAPGQQQAVGPVQEALGHWGQQAGVDAVEQGLRLLGIAKTGLCEHVVQPAAGIVARAFVGLAHQAHKAFGIAGRHVHGADTRFVQTRLVGQARWPGVQGLQGAGQVTRARGQRSQAHVQVKVQRRRTPAHRAQLGGQGLHGLCIAHRVFAQELLITVDTPPTPGRQGKGRSRSQQAYGHRAVQAHLPGQRDDQRVTQQPPLGAARGFGQCRAQSRVLAQAQVEARQFLGLLVAQTRQFGGVLRHRHLLVQHHVAQALLVQLLARGQGRGRIDKALGLAAFSRDGAVQDLGHLQAIRRASRPQNGRTDIRCRAGQEKLRGGPGNRTPACPCVPGLAGSGRTG